MTDRAIEHVLRNYAECLTTTCRERGCRLQLDGIGNRPSAIIHGTRFQDTESFRQKLCDRIVFLGGSSLTVAAVELKGGGNVDMAEAIEQIQNGLTVAGRILRGYPVRRWFPVLLYSGSMAPSATKLLQNKRIKFRDDSQQVIKQDCDSRLSATSTC